MITDAQGRLKILSASLRRAAAHPQDEEAIHKLRVAIRRFSQSLRVFEDLFEHRHVRKMRKRLRKLMDLCGAARNCDIAFEVLKAAGVPADKDLRHRLHAMRSRAGRELKRTVDSDTRSDVRGWRSWLHPDPKTHLPATGSESTHALLAKLDREFSRMGTAAARAEAPFDQMHKFRLLVKRYRYTMEILGGPKRRLQILRGLQERLGAVNDCVTISELLEDCGVKNPELRRIRTALNRLLAHRTAEFRIYWRKHKA